MCVNVFVQISSTTWNRVSREKSMVHIQFLVVVSEHLKHGESRSSPVYSNCGEKQRFLLIIDGYGNTFSHCS